MNAAEKVLAHRFSADYQRQLTRSESSLLVLFSKRTRTTKPFILAMEIIWPLFSSVYSSVFSLHSQKITKYPEAACSAIFGKNRFCYR